jgi:hypothetical protein
MLQQMIASEISTYGILREREFGFNDLSVKTTTKIIKKIFFIILGGVPPLGASPIKCLQMKLFI